MKIMGRVSALFFLSILFVSSSFSQKTDREVNYLLAKIRQAIKVSGAQWEAADNPILRKSDSEVYNMLMHENSAGPQQGDEWYEANAELLAAGDLDWRNTNGRNYITPVRNQRTCGSCWAFSSVACTEAQDAIENDKSNPTMDLSEQALVSCSGAGNCGGGFANSALNYIRDSGIPDETCFPYISGNGYCANRCSDWLKRSVRIQSWQWVSNDINSVKTALQTGPVIVSFYVYADFLSYSKGVYRHVTGDLQGIHSVVIVGYQENYQCWIVKNSWGSSWGESGFFRIAWSNNCGFPYDSCRAIAYDHHVTGPNGGEVFASGTNQTIVWTSNYPNSTVDLYYSINNGQSWRLIARGASNTGSYNWVIPNDPSSQCRIKVAATNTMLDVSDASFTILASPKKEDLYWYEEWKNEIQAVISTGTGFQSQTWATGWGTPSWAGMGDLNGDGRDDLIWGEGWIHEAKAFFTTDTGLQFKGNWIPSWNPPDWGALGDFNGDGKADYIAYTQSNLELKVYFSTGSTFDSGHVWGTGWGKPDAALVGDMNGDGKDDLLWYEEWKYEAMVFFSTGNGLQSKGAWLTGWSKPDWAALGDMNGDGKDDLIWYEEWKYEAQVCLSTGSSFNHLGAWITQWGKPDFATLADFNADGKKDLLWYEEWKYQARVLFSTGSSFQDQGVWLNGWSKPDWADAGHLNNN